MMVQPGPDSATATYAFQSSADKWSSWDVRAASFVRGDPFKHHIGAAAALGK
jgi:hypothetical protein